jgi:hypothetical protein
MFDSTGNGAPPPEDNTGSSSGFGLGAPAGNLEPLLAIHSPSLAQLYRDVRQILSARIAQRVASLQQQQQQQQQQ